MLKLKFPHATHNSIPLLLVSSTGWMEGRKKEGRKEGRREGGRESGREGGQKKENHLSHV
jgi:hypothetical protein